ncbi:chemotaxis protein CheW [Malaciobacter marinus]|uniref:Chemotaxis protein CheW n=1 Tax=Malaciobacter marinus TaxID=505249 RepID=A0A347TIA3_9BACT|nr:MULTISPECIES: chemotaxis protein CheW [Malaciobacter]AXX86331.1 purine-binding chemotaxis protein CheW [Malaciobacter marinus]PHO11570.1 chemotaxis protein CheW [Malaciobacter marinus]PHO14940.1 chemotaxis protein CheW [Malaciobacter marinus]RYA22480.1 chemotaxis protein CheW [Malaciobacter halophilus]
METINSNGNNSSNINNPQEHDVIDYENTSEYMTFELGAMKYAIELPKIREILTYPDIITHLPNTEDWVKGLINLRGEVVPILDIRIKFNTGEPIYDSNTAVIAVITEDKRMIGIIVDKVDDVQRLDTSSLAPVSDMGSAIPSRYLKGFVRLENNQMLVIMDIEAVVHKDELKDS